MKTHFLFRDKDYNSKVELPWNSDDLTRDLGLDILFKTMADEDELMLEAAQKNILTAMANDEETILWRQKILQDCMAYPSVIKNMYDIAGAAIDKRRNSWFGVFSNYPTSILSGSAGVIQLSLEDLKQLRDIAYVNREYFKSEGFKNFFDMLIKELSDDYFNEIETHLREVREERNLVISARLGEGNKETDFMLYQPEEEKFSWWQRLFGKKPAGFFFELNPRDEGGIRALRNLKDKGLNEIANVFAQSGDHILEFFHLIRSELAFYLGCLNLHQALTAIGEPVAFPVPLPAGHRDFCAKEIYDPCLALSLGKKMVPNSLDLKDENLAIITGANRGGKSTFLRSIGIAQLMMQSGMFVAADSMSAGLSVKLFTHFKREEDTTLKSGKFDEELSRMSKIANDISAGSMVLFNESFAATNEIEGSEIATQIVKALTENNVTVFYVTHLFDFANNIYKEHQIPALFLRAERKDDASRTFKIKEGEPLATSFGEDIYWKIFGKAS